jgi:chemotaxis protein histidine kinase CheA
MATDAPAIPRVEETGLERDDLTSAAEELGIDGFESWDDQQLFEQIGLQLGEISEDQLSEAAEQAQETAEDTAEQAEDAAEGAADEAEDTAEDVQDTAEGAAEDVQETAEDTAEDAQDTAEDTAEQAEDAAEGAADEAEDTAEDVQETAEDTAEDVQDTAEGAAEQAEDAAEGAADEAEDTAEDTAEDVQETAEDTAEDVQETAEDTTDEGEEEGSPDEYRPEDDTRPGIATVLDLELGPVALDLLGLEVHLNRIHAAIVANPAPNYAILGKLLAPLGTLTSSLGLDKVTDTVTDAVDSTLDVLPSPGGDDEDEESEDGGSVLSTIAEPFAAAGRLIKNLVTNSKDAAGEAKEAGMSGAGAVKNVASGNTMRAMKDGKNAVSHATKAAKRTAALAEDR